MRWLKMSVEDYCWHSSLHFKGVVECPHITKFMWGKIPGAFVSFKLAYNVTKINPEITIFKEAVLLTVVK